VEYATEIFFFISQHKTSATCIYCAQAGQISLATNVTESGFNAFIDLGDITSEH